MRSMRQPSQLRQVSLGPLRSATIMHESAHTGVHLASSDHLNSTKTGSGGLGITHSLSIAVRVTAWQPTVA